MSRASWTQRRVVDPLMRFAVRLGRDVDGVRVLEVRGRRTGAKRRRPVKVLEVGGERYLVSLYGRSGWAVSLLADPRVLIRFGRRAEAVVATPVPDDHKPPILAAYIASADRAEVRELLTGTRGEVTDEVLRRNAPHVPVFRLGEDA